MSKVAVIFGGPSPEHDVSILTGLQAARELTSMGKDVVGIYWSKTSDWYLVSAKLEGKDFVDGLPRDAQPLRLAAGAGGGFVSAKKSLFSKSEALDIEAAVVCCHGGPGEDGSLQGALDLAGIRYTGPNVWGAALTMDKLAFGHVMQGAGIPSLPREALLETTVRVSFDGPYIVKPRFGGSSLGIEIVENLDTARALLRTSPFLRSGAVVEPYRPESFDLNVGLRMFPEPQVSAIEKPVRTTGRDGILGYADKYIGGEGMVSAPRELPAPIGDEMAERIRSIALEVAALVGVRGVQRLDFLCDDGKIYVNELNSIPGSLAKYLWVEPVVSFGDLLTGMLAEARERPAVNWTTAGADGSALRSAGSIAGKLS